MPTPASRYSPWSAATSVSGRLRESTRSILGGAPQRRPWRSSAMGVRLEHGEDTLGVIHEINVTPFIDVILVLLIIFMIAAPLATVDVAVDLPTSNVERQPRPDQPIFLTIKSDLTLWLGDTPVSSIGLQPTLDVLSK